VHRRWRHHHRWHRRAWRHHHRHHHHWHAPYWAYHRPDCGYVLRPHRIVYRCW
jgi:hypothetical protein